MKWLSSVLRPQRVLSLGLWLCLRTEDEDLVKQDQAKTGLRWSVVQKDITLPQLLCKVVAVFKIKNVSFSNGPLNVCAVLINVSINFFPVVFPTDSCVGKWRQSDLMYHSKLFHSNIYRKQTKVNMSCLSWLKRKDWADTTKTKLETGRKNAKSLFLRTQPLSFQRRNKSHFFSKVLSRKVTKLPLYPSLLVYWQRNWWTLATNEHLGIYVLEITVLYFVNYNNPLRAGER